MVPLEGKAYWAILTPNTTYEPVYTVDLVVDADTASDFESRGFQKTYLSKERMGLTKQ